MEKKVLIVALTLIFVGASVYFYISNQQQSYKPTTAPRPKELTSNKEKLEKQINLALKEANYCNTKEECKVVGYRCPFGCYNLVNTTHDLEYIEEAVGKYNEDGWSCIYDCDRAPKNEEIDCIDRRCVDIRYPEE